MGEDGKGRKAGLIEGQLRISVSQTCMRVGAQWGIAHADIPTGPYLRRGTYSVEYKL